MRVLNANFDGSNLGVLTNRPGVLTNDFFVNLLDVRNRWDKIADGIEVFEAYNRESGEAIWRASRFDLVFGHNSQLRAIAEVYGSADAQQKFVKDFVKAWTKVMELDRFDVN